MQIWKHAANSPFIPTPVRAGTSLGIVDVTRANDAFLFAGSQIGKADGYASLRNAITAAKNHARCAMKEPRPIYRRDERVAFAES